MNKKSCKTKQMILKHFSFYPQMQLCDMLKFLFHSSFGCDHLVSSQENALNYIDYEYNARKPTKSHIEKLDGNYSRLYLGIINKGLSKRTLATLFYLSAKKEENGVNILKEKLAVLEECILNGELPFNHSEFIEFCKNWQNLNYPAIHHSQAFNQEYNPSYRVISNEFIPLLALLKKIDSKLNANSSGEIVIPICLNLQKQEQKTLQILSKIYPNLNFKISKNLTQNNKANLLIIK